jgi:diaminopimelate epimerase
MLRFTKMNGAGNDFILIDNRVGKVRLDRSQIAHLCDRHRGIGADGILLLENAINRADFRMRYSTPTAEKPRCAATVRAVSPVSQTGSPEHRKKFLSKHRPA